jgi:hypothetical protein
MRDLKFEKKLNPMYMSHIEFFILIFGRQVVKIGAPKKNGLN